MTLAGETAAGGRPVMDCPPVVFIRCKMLTNEWPALRPHAIQSKLWRTRSRFAAVVAGRGSGKTLLARRRVIRYLPITKPWSDPTYAYCLPTVMQAKRVAWPKLKSLTPRSWIKNVNETEMKIETVFGSQLYVFGMDKPQRAEGLQYDGVVIDESSDHRENVFDVTILPALSERAGWCWRIGVPKRFGVGAVNFKNFYLKGLQNECINGNPAMRIESFGWASADIADPDIIAFAKTTLDAKDFAEQFDASWEAAGGAIYYAYSEAGNVSLQAVYNPNLPLCIGSDFNVNPMSWVIGHRYKNEFHIIDEIFLRNVSTQNTLDFLFAKFGKHANGFEFFGDATGKARKTAANSAAQSDYIQIKNDQRFRGAKTYYPDSNPNITDRYAAVNAMLCNAEGARRIKINPRCERLRQDLEQMVYVEHTRSADTKNKDAGHITDALGYVINMAYPLRLPETEGVSAITTFAPHTSDGY